jgi:hypothetical protein
MQKTALYTKLIVTMLLIGMLIIAPALSSLTDTAVIRNTGAIGYASEVTAKSGSPEDIQVAVNAVAAAGGGTVFVPAGTFYWTGQTVIIPNGGVNIIGASPAGCKGHGDNWEPYTVTTILHTTRFDDSMFAVGQQTHGNFVNKPSRISGIQFEADAPANADVENSITVIAIEMGQIPDFRVDHCTFVNFNVAVRASANDGLAETDVSCYGVVDHCVFDIPYKLTPDDWVWGYGVYTIGNGHDAWKPNIANYRGKYGHVAGSAITYIEDCHFSRYRHATDANAYGYYVARFNLIDNPSCRYTAGMINDHGAAYPSARGFEAYSNTLVGLPKEITWQTKHNNAFTVRGGSAIITNNSYTDDEHNPYSYFLLLSTGDDVEGKEEQSVSNTYVWGNSYEKCSFSSISEDLMENVDYFLRAPTIEDEGFVYTPYPYPHPLTLEETR